MRLDYTLYILAAILFSITSVPFIAPMSMETTETIIWIVSTIGLGLLSIGLGYSQRPKTSAQACQPKKTDSREITETKTQTPTTIETSKEEKTRTPIDKPAAKRTPTIKTSEIVELTQVKGIGAKRATQLKALGINSVNELSKASAKTIAKKTKISPKIVAKWISNAKELAK